MRCGVCCVCFALVLLIVAMAAHGVAYIFHRLLGSCLSRLSFTSFTSHRIN